MKRSTGFLVFAALGVLSLLWWQSPGRAQGRSGHDFLQEVARSQGIPIGKLKIADSGSIELLHSKQRIDVAKVVDTETNQPYQVAFDQTGKSVDYGAALQDDSKAFREGLGKISPGLQSKMTGGGQRAAAALPVSIWVNTGEPPVRRPTPADGDLAAAMTAYLAALETYTQSRLDGVVNGLKSAGANGKAAKYGPAVFAQLSPGQIRQIARRPDVDAIYEQSEHGRFSDDASTTLRSHRVWQLGNLGSGAATRPAIHEDDAVSDFNPYLNNAQHPVVFFCSSVNILCPLGKNIGLHASEVASSIASTHPLYRGGAPNSQVILSANSQTFNDTDLVNAFEWAVGNSAGVINMSWGTICPSGGQTFWSRYADWAMRYLAITQTIAAGNDHPACPGNFNVSAPGIAWGPITVGAYDDNDNGFWGGDFMAGFSRYINPATGQDKPEVASVGQDVTMTDTAGGAIISNGTSFSSPLVASVVTQMLSRQSNQRVWPETNKAAILVSAMHDIVAGVDQDGVGAVVATVAEDTYRNTRFRNESTFSAADYNQACPVMGGAAVCRNQVNVFTASAGQRVRVAVAYDSWSTGGAGVDQLGADIDLYVIHPNNTTIVASSVSVANAWEMVDFIAPASGQYDIVIRLFSSSAGWPGSYLGTAWGFGTGGTTGTLPNFCAGEQSVTIGPTTLGNIVRSVNTANGSTYFDSYAGWGGAVQNGREGLIRIVLQTTRDITISDTNANLDLHLVQLTGAGCDGDPVVYNALLHTGNGPVLYDNLPPGTYYLIVDGANGAVGSTSVTINVSGP